MMLNNLPQSFVVYFPDGFFYPEVNQRWLPSVRKKLLPYLTLEDYINACIQSVDIPALSMPAQTQQWGRNVIYKRPGMALDEAQEKLLTVTFKLTEGYTSWSMWRQQLSLYFQIIARKPLFLPNIAVDFLNDDQSVVTTFEFVNLTPESLSNIELSYAARLASMNTFTATFRYNFINVWYYSESLGLELG